MCAYCMIGDHQFRYDPPFIPSQPIPYIPQPLTPLPATWQPWSLDRLREFEDLLRRVKDIEDKLGCPCEPNKADYLTIFRERIERLEREVSRREAPRDETDAATRLKVIE